MPDAMVVRQFRWRVWMAYGGHALDDVFESPADAGRWYGAAFGTARQPLTLEVLVDGELQAPTSRELFEELFEVYL